MTNYTYRLSDISLKIVPNNVQINLTGYLSDADGAPLLTEADAIDFFTVTTLETSLPMSGYESYFEILTESFINEKYTVVLPGNLNLGSTTVDNLSSTDGISPGMSVSGTGITPGTTVESIRTPTSLSLDQAATSTEVATSLTFGTATWTVDYSIFTYLTSIINFGSL